MSTPYPYAGIKLFHDHDGDAKKEQEKKNYQTRADLRAEIDRQKQVIEHLLESLAFYQQCAKCKRQAAARQGKAEA